MIYNLPIRELVSISAFFSALVMPTLLIEDTNDRSLSFILSDKDVISLLGRWT